MNLRELIPSREVPSPEGPPEAQSGSRSITARLLGAVLAGASSLAWLGAQAENLAYEVRELRHTSATVNDRLTRLEERVLALKEALTGHGDGGRDGP